MIHPAAYDDFIEWWVEFSVELEGIMDGSKALNRNHIMTATQLSVCHPSQTYDELESLIGQRVRTYFDALENTASRETIEKYVDLWNWCKKQSVALDHLFSNLNKNFVAKTRQVSGIDMDNMFLLRKFYAGELFLPCWETRSKIMKDKLNEAVREKLSIIFEKAEAEDIELVRGFSEAAWTTSIYASDGSFYDSFLAGCQDAAEDYFKAEAELLSVSLSTEDYLAKCEELTEVVDRFLIPASGGKIKAVVLDELVGRFVADRAREECFDGTDDLPARILNRLLENCTPRTWTGIAEVVRSHAKERYETILINGAGLGEDGEELYRLLRNESARQLECLDVRFHGNEYLLKVVREEFQFVVDRVVDVGKLAECWHGLIGREAIECEEYEERLNSLRCITSSLSAGALGEFKGKYLTCLSRKLLYTADLSLDLENNFFDSIFGEKDPLHSDVYRKMISDIGVSRCLSKAFVEGRNETSPCSFKASLLRLGTWPIEPIESISAATIPRALANELQAFEKFYKTNYNRKITWCHSMGRCELQLNYLDDRYIVETNLDLYFVLDIFSSRDSISFAEMQEFLSVKPNALSRCLKFLVGHRFLTCQLENDENSSERFSLNTSYENENRHFKMIMDQRDEKKTSNARRTVADKRMYIEALVVRTMKALRRAAHDKLLKEIQEASQHRILAKTTSVEAAIEKCIEKEYIGRAKDDVNTYIYIP